MASLICPEPLKVKKDASSEEKLGYGRYSTVYRIKVKKGEDKGKEYALKRVPRIPDNGQRKGQDITNLFKREVAALYAASRDKHVRMDISDDRRSIADLTLKVNIVSYEGHYIDCISQHNYKSSSAFIKNFVIATLMGLDHIFARWRMIHRDIKPGNIIKGKDGNWKITDFGTATVIGEDMSPAGTKELRAPEILNTENVMKDTSHQLKVDVFSLLGTILLAMKIRDFYERSKEFAEKGKCIEMIARHASSSKFEYPEFRSMAEIEPRYRSSVGELLWEIFEIKGESVWTPREKKTTHISGTAKLSHQETAPVAGTMAAGDRGSSRGNREPPPGFPLPLTSHLGPPDNYIPKASDSRYTISPEHYRDMPGGQYGPAPSYIMSAPRNEPFQASQDLPIRQSALNPVLRPRTSRRPEEAFETTGRKDDEDNDSDPEADTQRRHQRDRQPRRKKDERAHKGTRPKELTSSDDDDYDSEHGKHSRNHRRRHTPPPKTTLPPPKPIPPILKPSTSSGPREGDWEKHDGVWQKFSHGRWRNPKKYDTRRIADGKKVVYDGRDWRR